MDINSFCCAENKIWLGKVSCNFCRNCIHSTQNKDHFQPRRFFWAKLFTTANQRPLSLLTQPKLFARQSLWTRRVSRPKRRTLLSPHKCDERHGPVKLSVLVKVQVSCLRLTKRNTFCRCEHLFADVMYFTGDKVPTVCQQTFVPTSVAYKMCSTCSLPDQKPVGLSSFPCSKTLFIPIARPMKELKRQSSDWVKLWPVWISVMFRRKGS